VYISTLERDGKQHICKGFRSKVKGNRASTSRQMVSYLTVNGGSVPAPVLCNVCSADGKAEIIHKLLPFYTV
jgi:hypothetical protein